MGKPEAEQPDMKRRSVTMSLAMIAEAIFLVWPLVCIANRAGFLQKSVVGNLPTSDVSK